MFNYMQFNSFSISEKEDIAKSVWDFLLTNHDSIPADDFGSAIKELLTILKKRPKSRILMD